jgi:hypothetical protein
LFKIVSSIAAYAYSLEWLSLYGSHVFIAVLAGMIYFHLRTVKPYQWRHFMISCAVLAVLGSGLVLIANFQRSGQVADQLYMPLVLPPGVRVSPDHGVDEFMAKRVALLDENAQHPSLRKLAAEGYAIITF